jgi:hypothetical protein
MKEQVSRYRYLLKTKLLFLFWGGGHYYNKKAKLLALPALMDLALAGVDRGDSSPSTVAQRISSLFLIR